MVDAVSHGLTPEAIVETVQAEGGGSVAQLLSALQSAADAALGDEKGNDDHTFVVLRRRALAG